LLRARYVRKDRELEARKREGDGAKDREIEARKTGKWWERQRAES